MNKKPINQRLHIIAIGASAGGLEALQEFLSHLPELKNTCIIVAQHLSPTHKSMLVQLLSRKTNLKVSEAENGKALEVGIVYITPPDKEITILNNKIVLQKPSSAIGPKPSVDKLFSSLAENNQGKVTGVILSGTGSDGASGIKALKAKGAYILVQDPETATYDGMPQAAIQTEMMDAIVPPKEMGGVILKYLEGKNVKISNEKSTDQENTALNKVFSLLGKRSGTDFSNYKAATINRRLEKRMNILGIKSIEEYLKLIAQKPREADEMFKTILIGVTTFFRDKDTFKALEAYLKKIISKKQQQESIRIWVPGCSTGEEPYTIAILLDKILKDKKANYNIQIFATDIDERAISKARKGIYSESSLENLSKSLLEKYFLKKGDEFELIKSIRSMVLFSRHDIIKNPPFLKLDLISCRNLFIYFNAALQQQVIPIFHYAINPDAYLLLGKSETIGKFNDLFAAVDAKNKIFQRKHGSSIHSVKFSAFKASKQNEVQQTSGRSSGKKNLSLQEKVKETLFNTYEHPYVVVNENYDIQEVNGDVRLFLSLSPGSIQVNLLKMANNELQIELRSILSRAVKERRSIQSNIRRFKLFGSLHFVRITAKPLIYSDASEDYFVVIFEKLDIENFVSGGNADTAYKLENSRIQELESELSATKEHLQTYIEEIETSNEELQSMNEEMQSTNEELQSANEELETSNEELQSANEEIQSAYTELKVANEELDHKEKQLQTEQANTEALLNNDMQAFILVDSSYNILKFNNKAVETFEKLKDKKIELGESFIDLLPKGQVETFVQDFNKAVNGDNFQDEKTFSNAKGQKLWYSVNYSPVAFSDGTIAGISIGLLDITMLKQALSNLNETEKLANSVFNLVPTGICIIDEDGKFENVNDEYCKIYGYNKSELIGQNFTKVISADQQKAIEQGYREIINNEISVAPDEFEVINKKGEKVIVNFSIELLQQPDGKKYAITSVKDITQQKKAKEALEKALHTLKERNKEQKCLYKITSLSNFNYSISELLQETVNILLEGFQYFENCTAQIKFNNKTYQSEAFKKSRNKLKTTKKSEEGKTLQIEVFYHGMGLAFLEEEQQLINSVAENLVLNINQILFRETLQFRERRFRALVNEGSDLVSILDKNENFQYVSPNHKQYIGYADSELLHKNALDFIHPDDVENMQNEFKAFASQKRVKSTPYRFKTKNGNWRWIQSIGTNLLDDAAVNGIVINSIDITEIVKTQHKLKASEARYRGFYDSQTNYVIRTDMEGNYTYFNKKFEEEFGWVYPYGAILGNNSLPSICEHHHSVVFEVVEKCIAEPEKVFKVEIDKPTQEGGVATTLWDFVCVKDANGNPHEIQCMGIDITQRKEQEESLKQLNENLQKKTLELSYSNQELEQFAYVASHDLQEPLRMVTNFLTQLEKKYKDQLDEKAMRYIHFAVDGSRRMRQIILDLLEFSRVGKHEDALEKINLNELIKDVIALQMKNIEKTNAKIKFSKLPTIKSYRSPLMQVFQNLIGNALKYIKKESSPQIEIQSKELKDHWQFAVKDNGIGIEKENLEKVFVIFSRLHDREEYSGTGLGLAIVKKVVEKLGGEIWVESKPGKGSTFYFTLKK